MKLDISNSDCFLEVLETLEIVTKKPPICQPRLSVVII